MQIKITPTPLSGCVSAPVSKSVAHRLLICAALGDAPCKIRCEGTNADIEATVACLSALGADIRREGEYFQVTPISTVGVTHGAILDCGESGSTLRFLLPVVAALGADCTLIGHGRLPNRPLSPLYEELIAHGALLSENGQMPLTVGGDLSAGTFTIDGGVSSQFISGLLFALPLLQKPAEIVVTGKLQSARYIDLSLEALAAFGITPEQTESGWKFDGSEHYHSPAEMSVEGDWSNAAFWLVAGALPRSEETSLTVTGLQANSLQGDKAIVPLLREFGAKVEQDGDTYTVTAAPMQGIEIDAADIPDLVPILSVAAAFARGETVIHNIARLRSKESDRVETVLFLLGAFGVSAFADEDTLTIFGGGSEGGTPAISAPTLSSFNDHRIAMAAAIFASAAVADPENDALIIETAEAVRKSYPNFYESYRSLGGIAEEV
ncbi:MAG: 3-phosphoshikimate 1-carboxyvinyltransferase [Clostridia bacterium]|nr:3-phosphoshikimate 1-carboxyvinyltransferase [Clostridia bacterium]